MLRKRGGAPLGLPPCGRGFDEPAAPQVQQGTHQPDGGKRVQQAENLLERTLLERYGIAQVSAMNPGSLKVWSLEEQVPLFELLAPLPEKLGVTLLPSLMMRPEYSVSGVFFQTDSKFYNCQLCPKKECPNRRTPSLVT